MANGAKIFEMEEYRRSSPEPAPLQLGGGGGTFDGMEQRVQRLEEDVKEIKVDLKAVRVDMSYIKGRLDSMPTTIQLIMFAVAVFAAAGVARYFGH
jgi:hypothetical protein